MFPSPPPCQTTAGLRRLRGLLRLLGRRLPAAAAAAMPDLLRRPALRVMADTQEQGQLRERLGR